MPFKNKQKRRDYHKKYNRKWRDNLPEKKKKIMKKKAREYFYNHKKEHSARRIRQYHRNIVIERRKAKIRDYTLEHKQEILKKFNFECAFCERKPTQFHHITYSSKNRLNNILPLCKICHIELHKALRRKKWDL